MPRPLKYSGKRIREFEVARTAAAGNRTQLNEAIERLNKQERTERKKAKTIADKKKAAKEDARIMEEARREFLRVAAEDERQKKRAAAAAKKSNIIADIRSKAIDDSNMFRTRVVEPLIAASEKLIGKKFAYLQVSQKGKIVMRKLLNITGKSGAGIFYNSIFDELYKYEGGQDVNVFINDFTKDFKTLKSNTNIRVVITLGDSIPSERIQQTYREGEKHCVLEPIYRLFKRMADSAETDGSRKRLMQKHNQVKRLEEIYPDGVPESKMEEVGKVAGRCLVIYDIIGNETKKYNIKSNQYIYFTNTRANHLDEGHITLDKQFTQVDREEMNRLVAKHNKDKQFCLKYEYKNEVHNIRSVKGAWAVFNPDHEIFSDFSKSLGIRDYGIDAIKYPLVNDFVREARIINSAPTPLCDEPNKIDDCKHIDVEQAYTQHAHSKYYKGFLGHIQQWAKLPFFIDAKQFLNNHIGIFQFVVLHCNSVLLKKLGMKVGSVYTLPSPEIEYMMDNGLGIRLLAGAWGSSFDINYTEEMLENRRYCTWAGKLGMGSDTQTFSFNGSKEWASHLKAELGDEAVMYFGNEQLIIVKVPRKHYKTTHHILAFITSYCRINMLTLMSKVEGELVKVIMDGIYYRGEVKDVTIPHKTDKQKKSHNSFKDAWYYPSAIRVDNWPAYTENLDGSCVLAGAGGTGKSWSVLTNKGIISPLYVVPSHVLGRKCREKYGCYYTTINRLVGIECQPFKDTHYSPPVIFIDELTMVEDEWIDKAFAMYPNAVIYVAGDVDEKQWFQCRNGNPAKFSEIWKNTQGLRYVHYTNDMRAKDDELKAFKSDVRTMMREIFTDGGQGNASHLNILVKRKYKTVSFDEAVGMFVAGDKWIAGTHKTNEALLAKGIVSGYINRDKEIVDSDELYAIKRGSFTTHSFQGLTIETERVFVSMDFFEYAMFYTSISRVCNMKQLVIVRN
jgi:hypothetical protein